MDEAAFESVLRKHLKNLPDDQELTPESSLKSLGLDSMQAVELLFDLEDELGVMLPDEAMTGKTFETSASLEQAVREAAGRVS